MSDALQNLKDYLESLPPGNMSSEQSRQVIQLLHDLGDTQRRRGQHYSQLHGHQSMERTVLELLLDHNAPIPAIEAFVDNTDYQLFNLDDVGHFNEWHPNPIGAELVTNPFYVQDPGYDQFFRRYLARPLIRAYNATEQRIAPQNVRRPVFFDATLGLAAEFNPLARQVLEDVIPVMSDEEVKDFGRAVSNVRRHGNYNHLLNMVRNGVSVNSLVRLDGQEVSIFDYAVRSYAPTEVLLELMMHDPLYFGLLNTGIVLLSDPEITMRPDYSEIFDMLYESVIYVVPFGGQAHQNRMTTLVDHALFGGIPNPNLMDFALELASQQNGRRTYWFN